MSTEPSRPNPPTVITSTDPVTRSHRTTRSHPADSGPGEIRRGLREIVEADFVKRKKPPRRHG